MYRISRTVLGEREARGQQFQAAGSQVHNHLMHRFRARHAIRWQSNVGPDTTLYGAFVGSTLLARTTHHKSGKAQTYPFESSLLTLQLA